MRASIRSNSCRASNSLLHPWTELGSDTRKAFGSRLVWTPRASRPCASLPNILNLVTYETRGEDPRRAYPNCRIVEAAGLPSQRGTLPMGSAN